MANESEETPLEEVLNKVIFSEEDDAGDAPRSDPTREEISKARLIAVEECLHTIANFALELEAGKRESITAQDIRIAFASHDVEEIWTEAKIFFSAEDEESDLDGEGEDPDTFGAGAGDEEDGEEDEA